MIIITAATRWEAGPLEKLQSPGIRLLKTGMGPANARQAADALRLDASPLVVISSGFAGALQLGVRSGDLAADFREAPLDLVQSARSVAEEMKIPLHLGAFAAADRVLNPSEKRELGLKNRALAIDMESGALREWSKAHNGVFMAVRAVLDEVGDELPVDAPGEGAAEALRFAAKHWKKIPTLAMLGFRQKRAMDRLVSFLNAWLKTF